MSSDPRAGWARRLAAKPLYPWLLAVYPVVLIAASNIDQVAPHSIAVAVAGAFALATVLVLGFRIVLTGWHKAAIAAGIAVALFYAFGPVSSSLDARSLGVLGEQGAAVAAAVHRNAVVLSVVWLTAFSGAAFFIHRARENRMAALAGPLNLVSMLLIGFAAAQAIGSASTPRRVLHPRR